MITSISNTNVDAVEFVQLFPSNTDNYMIFSLIGLMGRVFANGPVDLGSVPARVIPKTLKIAHDTSLLKTQQY